MPTPRKPISRQIIEGDRAKRGKHKLQAKLESSPIAVKDLPECPAHLHGRARDAWDFWKLELELMQLGARPDAIALEGACVSYARAVDADLRIAAEGMLIEEPDMYHGKPLPKVHRFKKHPAFAISDASWALVKTFVCEFGLTPVSPTRLTVERHVNGDSDLNKLLSGPRLTPEEKKRSQ
jgi:P27 family predicted phage terminase small subunit